MPVPTPKTFPPEVFVSRCNTCAPGCGGKDCVQIVGRPSCECKELQKSNMCKNCSANCVTFKMDPNDYCSNDLIVKKRRKRETIAVGTCTCAGVAIPVRPDPSAAQTMPVDAPSNVVPIAVGTSIGALLLILLIVVSAVAWNRRNPNARWRGVGGRASEPEPDSMASAASGASGVSMGSMTSSSLPTMSPPPVQWKTTDLSRGAGDDTSFTLGSVTPVETVHSSGTMFQAIKSPRSTATSVELTRGKAKAPRAHTGDYVSIPISDYNVAPPFSDLRADGYVNIAPPEMIYNNGVGDGTMSARSSRRSSARLSARSSTSLSPPEPDTGKFATEPDLG